MSPVPLKCVSFLSYSTTLKGTKRVVRQLSVRLPPRLDTGVDTPTDTVTRLQREWSQREWKMSRRDSWWSRDPPMYPPSRRPPDLNPMVDGCSIDPYGWNIVVLWNPVILQYQGVRPSSFCDQETLSLKSTSEGGPHTSLHGEREKVVGFSKDHVQCVLPEGPVKVCSDK